MSLRWRLGVLVAALAVLLVATSLSVVRSLDGFDAERRLVQQQLQPGSAQVRDLLATVVDQETGERGFVITGDPEFLVPYAAGHRRFLALARELEPTFADDPDVLRHLHDVRRAMATWRDVAARPEIAARRSGDAARARHLVGSGAGKDAFDALRFHIDELQHLLDRRLVMAQDRASDAFGSLRNTILLSRLLLVALVVAFALTLRRWVLLPVERLRASMRVVASGRLDHRVGATGPPEVAAIGQDAEAMRRRIVAELDAARSATEALDQHSPVVAGLRRELAAPSTDRLAGVVVHGALHPAEGVLAGDWWAAVPRPGGRTALAIADVAGHGAEAGLVAVRFKQRLTVLLRTDLDLPDVFTRAAERLDEDPERLLSCLLVEVDPALGRLRWVNAGHPAALVARQDAAGLVGRELTQTGPLIGTMAQQWAVGETTLLPDELFVAVTDGVVEARRSTEEFGASGVLETLRRAPVLEPETAVDEIVEAVRAFADDWRRDDVTCVALRLAG